MNLVATTTSEGVGAILGSMTMAAEHPGTSEANVATRTSIFFSFIPDRVLAAN